MKCYDIKPLNHFHVHKKWTFFNRTHMFLHFLALLITFYYRASFFFKKNYLKYKMVEFLAWLLILVSELMLAFIWVLRQPYYWRPITRTVLPKNLPKDDDLPGIDVFICTADADKEPTFDVMNTVISAMALDYPPHKLHVYLSDDAGTSVTLDGLKDAWVFTTWWLPFCRRYDVKPPCPRAFFEETEKEGKSSEMCIKDRKHIKEKYEIFKERLRKRRVDVNKSSRDHPALVQVIDGSNVGNNAACIYTEEVEMPFLVYVAREKRRSCPHHFKAGALNVLQRISSIFSNSAYILVLDCDMYCNDTISARQAMCFFLDLKISSSLGWIQYPQKYHNITHSDIYDSQFRITWGVYFLGANGFHGPLIAGTNFYIQRKALYGVDIVNGNDIREIRESLGPSNELLKSLTTNNNLNLRELPSHFLQEAHFLASCIFEKDTKWGNKIGFWYDTVVEDAITCVNLHKKGWKSIYLNPKRPQFLGTATTNFNDIFIQYVRWYSGFIDLTLSNHFPLIHTHSNMHFVEKLMSSYFYIEPFYFFPMMWFSTILPLCFLYGIPLYPQVSDPFLMAFGYILLSSWLKHLLDVLISGGSFTTWLSEQRMWVIKSLTSYLYGTLECITTRLGFHEANFTPTNKVIDDDTTNLYQMGKYDFRTSNMFLVPLVTLVNLNMFCLIIGVLRLLVDHDPGLLLGQMILVFYGLVLSAPVIEGMVFRTDDGRVPLSTTLVCTTLSLIILFLGYKLS